MLCRRKAKSYDQKTLFWESFWHQNDPIISPSTIFGQPGRARKHVKRNFTTKKSFTTRKHRFWTHFWSTLGVNWGSKTNQNHLSSWEIKKHSNTSNSTPKKKQKTSFRDSIRSTKLAKTCPKHCRVVQNRRTGIFRSGIIKSIARSKNQHRNAGQMVNLGPEMNAEATNFNAVYMAKISRSFGRSKILFWRPERPMEERWLPLVLPGLVAILI